MDQNLYNVDKKVTDKGWNAMQEILDREMPTERPRRRIWILWFLALLLPAAGLLLWLNPAEKTPVSPVSSAERPIAQQLPEQEHQPADRKIISGASAARNEQVASSEKTEQFTSATPLSLSAPTTTSAAKRKATAIPATPATPAPILAATPTNLTKRDADVDALTPLATNSAPATPSPVLTPTPTAPAELDADITASTPPATSPEIKTEAAASAPVLADAPTTPTAQNTEPNASTQPATSPEIAPAAATPPSVITSAPTPTVEQDAAPATPIIPVRENKKSLSWGATVGVLSETTPGYAGATAGLVAEWRPGKRWGLRSGLAYQFHLLRDEDRPITSVTTAAYAEATGDQTIFDNTFLVSSSDFTVPVYVPVSRLHRLEIPLQVFWQPTRKVRLYAGASFGANFYAQTASRSLKNGKIYDVQEGTPARNLNQEVSRQIRGGQMGWNVGISYQPTKRIELGLYFQNPVTSKNAEPELQDVAAPNTSNALDVLRTLTAERQGTVNGRSVFQLSATAFF
jgi:hypothetical protein